MKSIIVVPEELWQFYIDNREELRTTDFEIAENPEYGIEVYLTTDNIDKPSVHVLCDDILLYSERICSNIDAENTANKIFDQYLTDKVVSIVSSISESPKEPEELDFEDTIEEREYELDSLVEDFLFNITGSDWDTVGFNDIIADCKEHFLEYIARKHDVPVYRPMILVDQDGKEIFEEYPYEVMTYDDPDNPMYK